MCEKYWPDPSEGRIKFGDRTVEMISEVAVDNFPGLMKRRLEIQVGKGNSPHRFTQYHYTGWPDGGGVPDSPK